MATERAAFWQAVGLAPADPAVKLVLADWLEERGERPGDLVMAYALRWCAARGKHPGRDALGRWWWGREPDRRRGKNWPHQLPALLFRAIPRSQLVAGPRCLSSGEHPAYPYCVVGHYLHELQTVTAIPGLPWTLPADGRGV